MPPLKSDTCRIKNGEKFFNQTAFTNTSRNTRQLYGVLQFFFPLFFLNFIFLTFWHCYLPGLESKQLWRCAINHSKKIIALEVFQTRNILNFGCSLNFWKTLHIQVMYALSEGILLFQAVLSGSQWSNKKAVEPLGIPYLKLHRWDLELSVSTSQKSQIRKTLHKIKPTITVKEGQLQRN